MFRRVIELLNTKTWRTMTRGELLELMRNKAYIQRMFVSNQNIQHLTKQ